MNYVYVGYGTKDPKGTNNFQDIIELSGLYYVFNGFKFGLTSIFLFWDGH